MSCCTVPERLLILAPSHSQFICDTLTNKCQANQAAKDLCKQAQDAANGGTAKTGGQADAFNAVFGTTTVRTKEV